VVEEENSDRWPDRSPDIIAVDYSKDDKFLNATMWLFVPPSSLNLSQYEKVKYMMFIDSDNDVKTGGKTGIDYKVEIGYNNKSQTWNRTVSQLVSSGNGINGSAFESAFVNETIKPHSSAGLHFSLNLNQIRHGDFYKVYFYAGTKMNGTTTLDSTDPVQFPPLYVSINTSPSTLTIRPGESRTIELQVNSTKGYDPFVRLSTDNPPGLETSFEFNQFRMPSSGIMTIPLKIHAQSNATTRPFTLFISADATIESLRSWSTEPTKGEYPMTISVIPPLTIQEMLFGSGVPIKIPQEYLLGFYGIFLSLAIPGIARWINRRKEVRHLERFMTEINGAYDSKKNNKDDCKDGLEDIKRNVDKVFAKGRLNESNYKILNEKIAYYEKILDLNDVEEKSE